jgi:hypothetical protein
MRSVCSVDGCGLPVKGNGFCNKHYLQSRKHGAPCEDRSHAPLQERFWRYVDKSSECWIWIGKKRTGTGYGQIGEGGRGGKNLLAHRVSYEIHNGQIPDGFVVMHVCDTPGCVNPAHLILGTTAENVKDAYSKRRKFSPFKQGESHHIAVLNDKLVREIRASPLSTSKLAKQFGCSYSAVRAVRAGLTWKHVT